MVKFLPGTLIGFDCEAAGVIGLKLVQFYQNHAALLAEWCMDKPDRVAKIGAGVEVAGGIREGTFQHEDFLATGMVVAVKARCGVVADYAGGMSSFLFFSGQGGAEPADKPKQVEFGFQGDPVENRGAFEKSDRNLFEGQDLDLPTYLRKGIKIVV